MSLPLTAISIHGYRSVKRIRLPVGHLGLERPQLAYHLTPALLFSAPLGSIDFRL